MIPKILKGKEVKEFIDFIREHITSIPNRQIEGAFNIVFKDITIGQVWSISSFFNEPFRPEMITEYFGMRITNTEYGFAVYGEITLKMSKSIFVIDTLTESYRLPAPKTLNDFIHNCLQAGLKLIWNSK